MAILINYDEIRVLFNEQYKKTAQLICDGQTHLDNLAEGFLEADRVIQKLPEVDAVEVVRCRDCRLCRKHPTSDKVKLCANEKWNTEYYPLVNDNDFCSHEKGETMAEYLERELFLKNVKHNAPFIYSIVAPITLITPSADVAPVRHGRWTFEAATVNAMSRIKCNICGWWTLDPSVDGVYKYCPNCGARMNNA